MSCITENFICESKCESKFWSFTIHLNQPNRGNDSIDVGKRCELNFCTCFCYEIISYFHLWPAKASFFFQNSPQLTCNNCCSRKINLGSFWMLYEQFCFCISRQDEKLKAVAFWTCCTALRDIKTFSATMAICCHLQQPFLPFIHCLCHLCKWCQCKKEQSNKYSIQLKCFQQLPTVITVSEK